MYLFYDDKIIFIRFGVMLLNFVFFIIHENWIIFIDQVLELLMEITIIK
jgi:hypothetical protein